MVKWKIRNDYMNDNYNIKNECGYELQEIQYIIQRLKDGHVYGLNGNMSDGYLSTNAVKLEKLISKMLYKIQFEKCASEREMIEWYLK